MSSWHAYISIQCILFYHVHTLYLLFLLSILLPSLFLKWGLLRMTTNLPSSCLSLCGAVVMGACLTLGFWIIDQSPSQSFPARSHTLTFEDEEGCPGELVKPMLSVLLCLQCRGPRRDTVRVRDQNPAQTSTGPSLQLLLLNRERQ